MATMRAICLVPEVLLIFRVVWNEQTPAEGKSLHMASITS